MDRNSSGRDRVACETQACARAIPDRANARPSPSAGASIYKDDVVEVVDGFEGHEQRWIAVLFENAGGGKCRLEAVCGSMADYLAKAPQRTAPRRPLSVVGQAVEPFLNALWRAQAPDQPPLGWAELILRH